MWTEVAVVVYPFLPVSGEGIGKEVRLKHTSLATAAPPPKCNPTKCISLYAGVRMVWEVGSSRRDLTFIQGRHDDSLTGEVPRPLASALPLALHPTYPSPALGGCAVRRFGRTRWMRSQIFELLLLLLLVSL